MINQMELAVIHDYEVFSVGSGIVLCFPINARSNLLDERRTVSREKLLSRPSNVDLRTGEKIETNEVKFPHVKS